ncbi:MAG: hypothetical protein R6V32_01960 [Bacteroidales bacterium]
MRDSAPLNRLEITGYEATVYEATDSRSPVKASLTGGFLNP